MHLIKTFLLTILLGVCLLNAAQAQSPTSVISGASSLSEQVDSAQSDANNESDPGGEIQDLLARTRQKLDTALSFDAQAKRFGEIVQSAPSELIDLRKKLETYQLTPKFDKDRLWPLVELKKLLATSESALVLTRKRLKQLEDQLDTETNFDIQARLSDLNELPSPENSLENSLPSARRAQSLFQEASKLVRNSEIAFLEQRQISRASRVELLQANIDFESRKLTLLEERVSSVNEKISANRQSEVARYVQTAIRIKADGTSSDDLRAIAETNIVNGGKLNELIEKDYALSQQSEANSNQSKQIVKRVQSLRTQLESTDLSSTPEFGAALRKYRDQLINFDDARLDIKQSQQELTRIRLAQFQLESDIMPYPPEASTPSEQADYDSLLEEAKVLRELLKTSYADYIDEINIALTKNEQLLTNSKNYAALIEKHLLWMPSAQPVSLATLGDLPKAMAWLGEYQNWQLVTLAQPLRLWTSLLLLAAALSILFFYSHMGNYVQLTAQYVGKVQHDRISYSFGALGITLLLAMPASLILLACAFAIEDYNVFSKGLSKSLTAGATVYYVINLVRKSVIPKGLAKVHFSWNSKVIEALRGNLRWFSISFTSLIIINVLIEQTGTAIVRDSLGRITFIAGTLVMASFAHAVLKSTRATDQPGAADNTDSDRFYIKYLLFPLLILVPLLVAALSASGFHYSAILLDAKLIESGAFLLLVLFAFYLVLRWLSINERRYTLKSFKEQRARERVQNQEREAASASGDAFPDSIDTEQIDLQKISDQTEALLKMLVGFVITLGLWSIWSDLFNSFQTLEAIELYSTTEVVDNLSISSPVTLWDFLLALLALIITYIGGKNIPGLLEVAFLSRMSLQQGTSYAVTSISRYLILIVGAVVIFHLLGAQWSRVQWLVAALSVGLGFGLQEIVANFVSGIVLLFERPIRIGDTVSVGDQMGTVSKIRIRATTILDWDNKEVIIPNKNFITERLINWTLSDATTRKTISVGVAYGSDVNLTENLLLDIAQKCDGVLAHPAPVALFVNFGASSLDFELRIFIQSVREILPVTHRLHKAIDQVFRENNIEIAFPQQDIHFDSKPIEVKLIQDAVQKD